ncbi:hypothetical protein MD484_g2077, partial [Candolleomyces efflorescens]
MSSRTIALPPSVASILARHMHIPQAGLMDLPSSPLGTSDLLEPGLDGLVHLPIAVASRMGTTGLQDCAACGLRHVDPDYVNLCMIPREMVQEMVGSVLEPMDLYRAASVSSTFKELVTTVLYTRLATRMLDQGFNDPRGFFKFIYRHKIYIAGPGLLPVLFPSGPRIPEFDTRIELHAPDSPTTLSELTAYLVGDGFMTSTVYQSRTELSTLFTTEVPYPHFGRTIKRVLRFVKYLVASGEKIIVLIFVSCSPLTGFLSVVEYPTTLFMIAVDGTALHILYPALTGSRRGLINMPFPKTLASFRLPAFFATLQPFFDLKENLNAWSDFRHHVCDQNPCCPLRLRTLSDNRSIVLPCSVDHPFMRMYARARYSPRIIFLPRRQDPFVAWRLRCTGTCMHNMAFPDQEIHYKGRYITSDLHVVDV